MAKHLFTSYATQEQMAILLDPVHMHSRNKRGKRNWLSTFVAILKKQSKSESAKMMVDYANYKDYAKNESCPLWFGFGVEWLAGHFLEYYGTHFNIHNVQMSEVEDSAAEDLGTDGRANTIRRQPMPKTRRIANTNSPVYIQVKGTTHHDKIHAANDGSRLTNFMANAMSDAMKTGHAIDARYVLFTTASGIHYKLAKMTNGYMEVIGFEDIRKRVEGDIPFLNRLRADFGLDPIDLELPSPDSEYLRVCAELEAEGYDLDGEEELFTFSDDNTEEAA